MSFNQIVWKMAKKDYKKYVFYYLCTSFSVMFFFIFASLYFNEDVVRVKETESIQYVLMIPGVALLVFIVFFISYAHNIFIKRRKSEFGLLMTLGMSNRDIGKLLLLENSVIALMSLISGIVGGILFSKLLFLSFINYVGIQGITFHLNGKMFYYTILLFLLIFAIVVGRSLFLVMKQSIIINLKNDSVAESIQTKSPFIGGLGIAIVMASIIGLFITYTNPVIGGDLLVFWTLSTFMGLYMSLYQFTNLFVELAKKRPAYYYRKLLFLTNITYKFKNLTAILMLVTVMVMVTILYSTIILLTYQLTERQAMSENPFDIAFIQTEHKNNLKQEELSAIVNQADNSIEEHLIIPVYSYYEKQEYDDSTDAYHFMSIEEFNKFSSKANTLGDQEFLYYVIGDPKMIEGSDYYRDNAFSPMAADDVYKLKEIIVGNDLNLLSNLSAIMIVNPFDLAQIKKDFIGFESNIHLMNITDWKSSAAIVAELDKALEMNNEGIQPIYKEWMTEESEAYLFQSSSKIEDYNQNKNSNGFLFFVTTILNIMFFFGSFILLYLNLFSEIEKEKER